jgi:hypothetical protein
MTRQYNQVFTCVNCGCVSTTETSFGRWIRENPRLDSQKEHIVVYDLDYVVHKFRTHYGRTIQLIMMLEVKTRNSDMTEAQRDTMYLLSQLTENRRRNKEINSKPDKWVTNTPHSGSFGSFNAYSPLAKRFVDVKSFGLFKLQFSHLGPDDSEFIGWNGKPIDNETLERLIRFDIDPVTFKPIEELFRSHHKHKQQPLLACIEKDFSDGRRLD